MNDVEILPRKVTSLAKELLEEASIINLQGARQVGKSTIAKILCEKLNGIYRTLDDATTLENALGNPDSFVAQAKDKLLVIDEIQLAPELMGNLKIIADDISSKSKFLITGSVSLLGLEKAKDSLAGRVDDLQIFPFSECEIEKSDFKIFNLLEGDFKIKDSTTTREEYISKIVQGGYPVLVSRKTNYSRLSWAQSYIRKLSQHDAVLLKSNLDSELFTKIFSGICALSTTELNKSRGNDFGLSRYQFEEYLKIFKRLFLLDELPCWSNNLLDRATKRAKIYVNDSGLMLLMNRVTPENIEGKNLNFLGPATETFVISEIRRQLANSFSGYNLYHYRDYDKREIDLIVETPEGKIVAIEIKSKSLIKQSDLKNIKWLQQKLNDQFLHGIIFHTGTQMAESTPGIYSIPIDKLWTE
ncbi:MAG: ATP-binding protein [Micrococcaceae bacterium]